MARKTPGDDSAQKRRRSKPRNREVEETPPPLTQKEFEQAFKQYCSEKGVPFEQCTSFASLAVGCPRHARCPTPLLHLRASTSVPDIAPVSARRFAAERTRPKAICRKNSRGVEYPAVNVRLIQIDAGAQTRASMMRRHGLPAPAETARKGNRGARTVQLCGPLRRPRGRLLAACLEPRRRHARRRHLSQGMLTPALSHKALLIETVPHFAMLPEERGPHIENVSTVTLTICVVIDVT